MVGLAALAMGGFQPARPPVSTSAPTVRAAVYESAAQSRRTARWSAPTASANAGVLSNLATLRDRSRHATRNDGYAKSPINKLVNNLIGTGIKPLSQADDPTFRRAVQAKFLQWTDESDPDGLLDWYGQQTQAARGWYEGGEIFLRRRDRLPEDRLSVPIQFQVIEPELCPHTYEVARTKDGNRVRAGIELNPIGRRVAYYFHPSRPGDFQDFDPSTLRRIPADEIIHCYEPLRAGQLRGIPHLTAALMRLYELDQMDDAVLLRQKLSNMFVAFLKTPASTADVAVNPLTGASVTTYDDKPLMDLRPGLFQRLDPGEDVQFSEPPNVAPTYPDFIRQQLYGVSAATDVPYEVLTGDMSRVNDRTVRVILNEFRRRIQAWQHQIIAFQICRRVWNAWMDRVFISGALPIPASYVENPEPWRRVKWMAQGWPYLHPVQDIEAQRAAVRAGFSSRSAVVSEQGEDAEAIDAEQVADNERADDSGLKYDSDARWELKPKNQLGQTDEGAPTPTPEGAGATR